MLFAVTLGKRERIIMKKLETTLEKGKNITTAAVKFQVDIFKMRTYSHCNADFFIND